MVMNSLVRNVGETGDNVSMIPACVSSSPAFLMMYSA